MSENKRREYMSRAELIAEIERLEETLKFYADKENWRRRHEEVVKPSKLIMDTGDKAREALGRE